MSLLALFLLGLLGILSVRTLLAHLLSWQLREYRWDRMRGYLRTKQGLWNIVNLWFFKGFFPRPKFTGRICLILLIFLAINFILIFLPWTELLHNLFLDSKFFLAEWGLKKLPLSTHEFMMVASLLCLERLTWLTSSLAVFISSIPVNIEKKNTFQKVGLLMKSADQSIIKIGIAGSFGKSSTKNILVHLLQTKFGSENILFTPENLNNEYAIARFMLKHKDFFKPQEGFAKRFFVLETAAYARGEIKQIAQVVRPEYSLLTGLNSQHLETFGSLKNIQKAKTELTQYTTLKSFFNASNQMMQEAMDAVETKAQKIPVMLDKAEKIKSDHHQTTFLYDRKPITLPWPGKFFVMNALLCLKFLDEFKTPAHMSMVTAGCLDKLPPQNKALASEVHVQGFKVLKDLYSQNPDGTLQAVTHLGQSKGRKVFIGMPLLELAENSIETHTKLFEALKLIKAHVYWTKQDYSDLGKTILGPDFHMASEEIIQHDMPHWDKDTTVLLEGRLPESILRFF